MQGIDAVPTAVETRALQAMRGMQLAEAARRLEKAEESVRQRVRIDTLDRLESRVNSEVRARLSYTHWLLTGSVLPVAIAAAQRAAVR